MSRPLIPQGSGPLTAYLAAADEHTWREQRLARAIIDTTPTAEPTTTTRATLPGDTRRLRGIPAIGYGVTGAIPGTTPGTQIS